MGNGCPVTNEFKFAMDCLKNGKYEPFFVISMGVYPIGTGYFQGVSNKIRCTSSNIA
jgi:NADH:ubiquinone oxidoreductase subunit B-like Fe-S oxidoreductase